MARKTKGKAKEGDYERLVEQESLILEATELLSVLIEEGEVNRKELAEKLGRSKGFVTQILSGDRNMTLRTLADFAYALEHRVKVAAAPLIESGDGGEAENGPRTARARVWPGAGELLARSADEDPRRPLAAEGAGPYFDGVYAQAQCFIAGARGESAQLGLEAMPPALPGEMETVAG